MFIHTTLLVAVKLELPCANVEAKISSDLDPETLPGPESQVDNNWLFTSTRSALIPSDPAPIPSAVQYPLLSVVFGPLQPHTHILLLQELTPSDKMTTSQTDSKQIYRASTTAPVNIAVVK